MNERDWKKPHVVLLFIKNKKVYKLRTSKIEYNIIDYKNVIVKYYTLNKKQKIKCKLKKVYNQKYITKSIKNIIIKCIKYKKTKII